MKEDFKTLSIVGLVAFVGLLAILTGYFYTAYQEQKKDTKSVTAQYEHFRLESLQKLSVKSNKDQIEDLFNKKISFGKKPEVRVVWDADGQFVYEDEFFATYGLTKEAQKDKVREALFKEGAKRYQQTCNQLYGPNNVWSLGYCTLEPYPKGMVA